MPRFRIFAPVGIGLLMVLASAPARAAEGSTGAPLNPPAPTVRVRQLLTAGQTDQAERLVRAALAADDDDALLCLSGDIHYRRANFHRSRPRLPGRHRPEPRKRPRLVWTGPHRTGPLPHTPRPRPVLQGVLPRPPRHRHHPRLRRLRHRPRVQIHPLRQCRPSGEPRSARSRRPRRRPTPDSPAARGPPSLAPGQPVRLLPPAAHRIPPRQFGAGWHPGRRPHQRRQAPPPPPRHRSARHPAQSPRRPRPRPGNHRRFQPVRLRRRRRGPNRESPWPAPWPSEI